MQLFFLFVNYTFERVQLQLGKSDSNVFPKSSRVYNRDLVILLETKLHTIRFFRVGKNRDSRNKRRSEQRRSFLAEAFFLSQPISFCRLDTSSPHFRRVHERKGRRDNGSRNSRRWRKTGREIEGAPAQKLDLTGTVEEKLPRNSHETKRNGTKALGYFFQRLEEKMEGESEREKGRGRKEEASLSSSLCERDAPLCSF